MKKQKPEKTLYVMNDQIIFFKNNVKRKAGEYHCCFCGKLVGMRPSVPSSINCCKDCLKLESIDYPMFRLLRNYRLNWKIMLRDGVLE